MRLLFWAVLVAAMVTPAAAQDSKFWTRDTSLWVVADGMSKAADAYFTQRALDGEPMTHECYIKHGVKECPNVWIRFGVELDPIARPFVKTRAGRIEFFSTEYVGDTLLAYYLHKHGHDALARRALQTGVGYSASGAVLSAHTFFTF